MERTEKIFPPDDTPKPLLIFRTLLLIYLRYPIPGKLSIPSPQNPVAAHLPMRNLRICKSARDSQSISHAAHTPNSPTPRSRHSAMHSSTRKIHRDTASFLKQSSCKANRGSCPSCESIIHQSSQNSGVFPHFFPFYSTFYQNFAHNDVIQRIFQLFFVQLDFMCQSSYNIVYQSASHDARDLFT